MNLDEEIQAGMTLNRIEGLGPIKLHQLVAVFGTATETLNKDPQSWAQVIGDISFCEKISGEFKRLKEDTRKEWEHCHRSGVRILSITEGPYPKLLKEIRMPPTILYVRGFMNIEDMNAIAIVGSRRCSYYGSQMARTLTRELVEASIATVSGLARGIDKIVHEETLLAGGKTVAVIGCGLDICYPSENKGLFERISESGAVISEFPLGTQPFPGNFPRRNRIIAGLSYGTVVVEGTAKSGSLITAKIAAHEGRDVYAVPGPVTSLLSGAPNILIREGATLIRSASDIIDTMPEEISALKKPLISPWPIVRQESMGPAGEILRHLETEELSREALLERVAISAEQAAEILVYLELEGRIKSLPGGIFTRV